MKSCLKQESAVTSVALIQNFCTVVFDTVVCSGRELSDFCSDWKGRI